MHCREEWRQAGWGDMNYSAALPQWALDSHPPPQQPQSQRTHSGLVEKPSKAAYSLAQHSTMEEDHTGTSGDFVEILVISLQPRQTRFDSPNWWELKLTCARLSRRVVDGTCGNFENVFCWFPQCKLLWMRASATCKCYAKWHAGWAKLLKQTDR